MTRNKWRRCLFPWPDTVTTEAMLEEDFWRGEHFRLYEGGYTNCWMLPAGDYFLFSNTIGCRVPVSVTRGFHLTELESMRSAGLGSVDDAQIVQWDYSRFCHLVDMRTLYVDRRSVSVDELIDSIKAREQVT